MVFVDFFNAPPPWRGAGGGYDSSVSAKGTCWQPLFCRTQAGAEVDLVLELDPGSRWEVEIKR